MDDGHEGAGDRGGFGVLDDVATIDDAGGALGDERGGAGEDFGFGGFAAAAHEDGNAAGGLDDFVVDRDVVGGVGLDDVGAEFDGLADERDDFGRVAVDHVAAGFGVGLEDEGLDHERHAVVIAERFEDADVLDALVGDLGLFRNAKKIHDDAGGIEAHALEHGVGDGAGEERARELGAVDVGDIGAQDEGGLAADGKLLEMRRLPDGELDGVRRGGGDRGDGGGEILDPGEKRRLIEEAVIEGDIEAAAGLGIEETIEAGGFHREIRRSKKEGGYNLVHTIACTHSLRHSFHTHTLTHTRTNHYIKL